VVKNGFPSEEERELVRKYVIERDLYRPPITYLKAMVIILGAIIIELCLLSAGYFLLVLNNRINKYLYYIFSVLLLFIIDGRLFAIVLIKLYQHYAPERIRRRCLLKPTCSEFAIIVIKKYGLLIGGIKTWIRLNYKCRGNVYYIDEPK